MTLSRKTKLGKVLSACQVAGAPFQPHLPIGTLSKMFLETSSPSSGATTPTHQKPPSREDGEALDETASNDVCASTPLPKQRSPLHRLLDDVSVTNAEYPLLACCIVAGLVDSVVFNATGVFASMQTGAIARLTPAVSSPHSQANQFPNFRR